MQKKRKLGTEKLSEFFRQFSVLISSGLPVPKALEIMETDETDKRFSTACRDLRLRMNDGMLIGDAMAATGCFPELAVQMIRSAEMGGHLGAATMRLSTHYEKEHRTEGKIRGAVLYPKLLFVMMIFLLLFVFLVILPTLEPLLADAKLPFLTRVLMDISHFLYESRYFLPMEALIILAAVEFLITRPGIRRGYDRILCFLPVLGRQVKIICTARFCENMSSLYSSGLPIPFCLKYTMGTIGNRYLDGSIRRIMERVENGKLLSEAIRESGCFDKKLAAVIVTGEEAGCLDEMLRRLAENYEHEADLALTKLMNLLEPAMILLIGALTGFLILGIMEPIWNMYGSIGG